MAKYTFYCEACGKAQQKYVGFAVLEMDCPCGAKMYRQLPQILPPTVHEMPDKDSGKQWIDDQPGVLRARKEKYFWEVEVPRMVASGVYTIETMLENGWVTLDDNNHLVINTKPPSQR